MLIIVFMWCFIIYPGYSHHGDLEGLIFEDGKYGVTTYRLLMDKYPRNTAFEICQLYGGNLVRPDSLKKVFRLLHLNDQDWNLELNHDIWIDLIRDPDDDSFKWTSDCEPHDPLTQWNGILANFDYNSNRLCVVLKDHSLWNSKQCSSDALVVCETFEAGKPCTYGPTNRYTLKSYSNVTETDCLFLCSTDESCWVSTYIHVEEACLLSSDISQAETPGYARVTTKVKSCYIGELVQTLNTTWNVGAHGNDDDPIFNCASNTLSSSLLPTQYTYSTSSEAPPEETQTQSLLSTNSEALSSSLLPTQYTYSTSSEAPPEETQTQSLLSTSSEDLCPSLVITQYATATVMATTTNDVTFYVTASPVTVLVTTEIPKTLVRTTEVLSQVVTTVVSTDITTTTVEIPTVVPTTVELPASNVTITATPSVLPVTTVVSSEVVTTTAEVTTTFVVTETPSLIVSTIPVTVALTSTVIVPTTVVSSNVEIQPTTVLVTTTVHATNWSTVTPLAPAELEQKLENLVKNLTVPKTSTKAYHRRFVCAEDERESAKTVGYIGVVLLVVPLALLICLDLPSAAIKISKLRDSFKGRTS
ncbi:uncharacterized protein [Argopecten irradians]|uniref:uncharacterized protein n=1 Tax=Argopecten irradians TaxID=31199 RepID=UPI00371DCAF7